jgi:manganese/zinc/iron transport system substrate-binding protein
METNMLSRGVKNIILAFITISVLTPVVFALGTSEDPGNRTAEGSVQAEVDYPYAIGTTVAMVTDITRQVAGDKAVVTGIIGEGVDPHLYTQ